MSEHQTARFYAQYDCVALACIKASPGRTHLDRVAQKRRRAGDPSHPHTAQIARSLPSRFSYGDEAAMERAMCASAFLASLLASHIESDEIDDRFSEPSHWEFRACHWTTMRNPANHADDVRAVSMLCYTPHEELCVALYNVAALASQLAVCALSHGRGRRRVRDATSGPLRAKGLHAVALVAMRAVYLECSERDDAFPTYGIKNDVTDASGSFPERREDYPPHAIGDLLEATLHTLSAQVDRLGVELLDEETDSADSLLYHAHHKYEAAHMLHNRTGGPALTLDVVPGRDARLSAFLRHFCRAERLLNVESTMRMVGQQAAVREEAVRCLHDAGKSLSKHRAVMRRGDSIGNNPMKLASPVLAPSLEIDGVEDVYGNVIADVGTKQWVSENFAFDEVDDLAYLRSQTGIDDASVGDERASALGVGSRVLDFVCNVLGVALEDMLDTYFPDAESESLGHADEMAPDGNADLCSALALLTRISIAVGLASALGRTAKEHADCEGDASSSLHSEVSRAMDDIVDAVAILEDASSPDSPWVPHVIRHMVEHRRVDQKAFDGEEEAQRVLQRFSRELGIDDNSHGLARVPRYVVHNLSVIANAVFERTHPLKASFLCLCMAPTVPADAPQHRNDAEESASPIANNQ